MPYENYREYRGCVVSVHCGCNPNEDIVIENVKLNIDMSTMYIPVSQLEDNVNFFSRLVIQFGKSGDLNLDPLNLLMFLPMYSVGDSYYVKADDAREVVKGLVWSDGIGS